MKVALMGHAAISAQIAPKAFCDSGNEWNRSGVAPEGRWFIAAVLNGILWVLGTGRSGASYPRNIRRTRPATAASSSG